MRVAAPLLLWAVLCVGAVRADAGDDDFDCGRIGGGDGQEPGPYVAVRDCDPERRGCDPETDRSGPNARPTRLRHARSCAPAPRSRTCSQLTAFAHPQRL